MNRIKQNIGISFQYDTLFTRDVFSPANLLFRNLMEEAQPHRRHRVLFFVEESLLSFHSNLISAISEYCKTNCDVMEQAGDIVLVQGGEAVKNIDHLLHLCKHMSDASLCRQSFTVAIGGGAFLDTVGFAASIVHRGIRLIRFPTTVLSQNDSGVGVKNAINMFGKKNFTGTFAPPFAVINDLDFLDTLDERQWRAGTSEALKVALIKDGTFFDWLCANSAKIANRDADAMAYLVERCAMLHLDHIANSGDPFEFGSARPLDFGHWTAHKLEMLSNGDLNHGEAVAIGIFLDSIYAFYNNLIERSLLKRLEDALRRFGFDLYHPCVDIRKSDGTLAITDGLEEFREHLGGELHITLPNGLGSKIEVHSMDISLIEKSVAKLSETTSGKTDNENS